MCFQWGLLSWINSNIWHTNLFLIWCTFWLAKWLLGKYKQWLNFSDANSFFFFFLTDFILCFLNLPIVILFFAFLLFFFSCSPNSKCLWKNTCIILRVSDDSPDLRVFCCELVFMYQVDDSVCLPTVAAALAFVATFHLVVYN